MTEASGHGHAVIVFNPVKIELEELRPPVERAAEKHGWNRVEWVETSEDDPGEGQARTAAESGADMVVAAGGDGTVRAVAAGLRDLDAELGLIPVGTGNLLARNLKIPLARHRAIETAFGGQGDRMDICIAEVTRPDDTTEDIVFVVMAGAGVDAQMIINTDDDLKARWGFLAYGFAGLKAMGGGNRIKLLHRMDRGKTYRTSVHSVIVGNCGELIAGVALLPDARANDGILDVVAIRPHGLFGWVQIVFRLLDQMAQKFRKQILGRRGPVTGSKNDAKYLQYVTGEEFSVEFAAPEVFEVDGDDIGEIKSFRVTVDHLGLGVRVTEPAPREEPGEPDDQADLEPQMGAEKPDETEPEDRG